ncbi:MAG: DUF4230 domain-containing protein [Longimicrobiales bacterium]
MLLLLIVLGLWLWRQRPRITEEEVQALVRTTIERETPAAYLVTGALDLTATSSVSNTRMLLPDLLDLPLSTVRTTVRMPGRVSYGFDVRALEANMIRLQGDSVVEVQIPPLTVFAVEPRLDEMEIETSRGWMRLPGDAPRRIERRAIANIEGALRAQAGDHLRRSVQAKLNTARALETLLLPAFRAAGLDGVRLHFEIEEGVHVTPRDVSMSS